MGKSFFSGTGVHKKKSVNNHSLPQAAIKNTALLKKINKIESLLKTVNT